MRFGADYYPEHWPEERWETDAKLMQEAGFNIVRLAEFAWVKMEPEEGRFEFDWLLKALDILSAHGISSVIGTPTATPPAWLCTNKPSILRIDENRNPVTFGNRQQACINQLDYQKATDAIVTALAEKLGQHPGVYGWQIDNEFGQLCYCEECRKQFQDWLKAKYKNLHELEKAWGTIFWSQTYTDWRQIPLPWKTSGFPNPSLALDYRRFCAESFSNYMKRQINIVRKFSDKPITHNFMGIWPDTINYQQLADQLDFVSWDNYPVGNTDPQGVAAGHDLSRGYLGKNYWMMEQMSGPLGWADLSPAPKRGQIRQWTYQAIGRGADGILYFRWRPCRSGTEQYVHGILNHDGSISRRYEEIKRTRKETLLFEDILSDTTIKAEVAIINDYDSRFAFQYQFGNSAFSYTNILNMLHNSFYKRNTPVDIISGSADLSEYKVVAVPALFVLTPDRAEQLKQYVKNGGTLIMTFRSAVKDETGLIFDEPLPGLMQDVFGMKVKEYHSPSADEDNSIWGVMGAMKGISSEAGVWLDLLELNGAKAVAKHDGGFIPGEVAISRNEFGQGKAYYIGTHPSQDFTDSLINMIAEEAGVRPGIETPEGVEASVRSGKSGELLFLINHTVEPQTIRLPNGFSWDIISGNRELSRIELDPYQVAVVRGE